jgi:hypothetical protein
MKDEIKLTATKPAVIDFRRFYKQPKRVYGEQPATYCLLKGETVTFADQDQLLRALAGQLTSKETFGMVLKIG